MRQQADYRASLRSEINELLAGLAAIDCEVALKGSLLRRLLGLLRDVGSSRPGNYGDFRLLKQYIRDARRDLDALKTAFEGNLRR